MTGRLVALLGGVALALGAPTARGADHHDAAGAEGHEVAVQFAAFGPAQVDVLPGEPVGWTNVSDRQHTVTSDTGAFSSGVLDPDGTFAVQLDEPGSYPYHCTLHPAMVGEVDVRRVILGPLPTAAVPAGDRVAFDGRTADRSAPVRVEHRAGDGSWAAVATAQPGPDGHWHVAVTATRTGDFRASSGADASQTRRLLVSDRRVLLMRTRTGVRVTVSPSLPYAHIVLQAHLRERFGWWPVARARLDYVSQARLRVARRARVRVVLVDRDGWTPLATSRVLTVGGANARPAAR